MSALSLQVRYFQDSTPKDVPCREENFIRREITMPLPIEQTAFVLVDVWNMHFIESWIERANAVIINTVVPALNAARNVGLTIIHAPSALVVQQSPQLKRHAPSDVSPPPDWPPPTFQRREGEYAVYRGPRHQPPGRDCHHWSELRKKLAISPAIEVRDDDLVIATGGQLHNILKQHGILHLIYLGFATNWCVLGKDYGIRAMVRRGYNVILLRDATIGIEFPDTLEGLFTTEIAIREVEQQNGFTASNEDFFAACHAVSGE